MYSNYLTEVGKLVFILGDIETTSQFKKLLESVEQKQKIFFKCLDELPVNSYKKIKVEARRKGILRVDWFNKVLDRSPMMIFMVFNYTPLLQKNQKWEDRLNITNRKINKVVDILRSSNKQDIILRIIIIISKEAVVQSNSINNSVNVVQKITSFLKIYERDLHIFQSDLLTKQVSKNRPNWFAMLDKSYERKHRSIAKRRDQNYNQVRIGCIIKMAILSEIISKKDSYSQYDDAYKAIHFKFMQTMRSRVDPFNFDPIRELRTMADIVFLRMLIVKINITYNYSMIPDAISNHLKYFIQKDANHYFFQYENMMWRQNFLQNLLEVIHMNDHIEFIPKNYFVQLINGVIDLSYTLCQSHHVLEEKMKNEEVKGRLIPVEEAVYIGARNYTVGIQITDVDIVWTEMNQLIEKRKDYATKGLQNITRYKSMKKFNKSQLNFLNTYLLRFYLADNKLSSAQAVFNILIASKLEKIDYYFLNGILKELGGYHKQFKEQSLKIYGVAILLADYYKNEEELVKYGELFVESLGQIKGKSKGKSVDLLGDEIIEQEPDAQLNIPRLIFPLYNKSNIFKLQINFPSKLHPIQQKICLKIYPSVLSKFTTILKKLSSAYTLQIMFNHQEINFTKQIRIDQLTPKTDLSNGCDSSMEMQIEIDPLQYFRKDQLLYFTGAVLRSKQCPWMSFYIHNVSYTRYQNASFYTKLQVPQIKIKSPYNTYFLNQMSKLTIDIGHVQQSVCVDTSFTVATEDQKDSSTQIYVNYDNKMNLTNSKIFEKLQANKTNILYMKCNKIGISILKFMFSITITQTINDKTLKNTYQIVKEIGFKVVRLFKTLKIIKESYTGNQLKASEVPSNKKIILSYCLRTQQMINIKELNQHSSPKDSIKMYKKINKIQDMILNPEQKLKNIVIFEIVEDLLEKQELKKQIFVVSFYIKWNRIDLDMKLGISDEEHPCDNMFIQEEMKVSLKTDQVQVQYQQGVVLKKCQKEQLSVKYRNLTNQSISIYSMMDNSESILRIGSRHQSMIIGPKQTKKLIFQILPIKSGYHSYPEVKNFFDGIEARQKVCNTYLCVI